MALLCWASTIAIVRTLSETMGPIRSAACIHLVGGTICALWLILSGRLRRTLGLPPRYLIGCGVPFAAYVVLLHLAVGLAPDRLVAAEVLLINYLWPPLVVVLSLPLLGNRARWTLLPGLVIALAGIVVGVAEAKGLSWSGFTQHLGPNLPCYLLALGAAVSWALYSNLSRRWAVAGAGNAIPLFIAVNGVVLFAVQFFLPAREFEWTPRLVAEIGYMVIFPTLLAYTLWDIAVRRGHFVLLGALSYVTPILSLWIAAMRWGTVPQRGVWLGGALIVVGAIVCKLSVKGADQAVS